MSATRPAVICTEVAATERFGQRLGGALEPGMLVSLEGPLGAGKTTLVRGIAVGTGADPLAVKSPTFVLHHVYPGERLTLHHLDLYRLGAGASLQMLDLDTQLDDGAVVVEWGDLGELGRWTPIRVAASIDGPESRRFRLLTADVPAPIRSAWDSPP
jgi:tRNA threonylcarbamoyladenosine biosynthesis protein TsaE